MLIETSWKKWPPETEPGREKFISFDFLLLLLLLLLLLTEERSREKGAKKGEEKREAEKEKEKERERKKGREREGNRQLMKTRGWKKTADKSGNPRRSDNSC